MSARPYTTPSFAWQPLASHGSSTTYIRRWRTSARPRGTSMRRASLPWWRRSGRAHPSRRRRRRSSTAAHRRPRGRAARSRILPSSAFLSALTTATATAARCSESCGIPSIRKPRAECLIRAEFIIGLLTYQGDGHDEATVEQLHAEHDAHGDLALVNAREATRDPYRGDPKCTGEKILAWFQQVVVVHRGTRFFLKADWDSWIHTVRLEHNLRSLLTPRTSKALYFGNTLWCSYSMADYQPCGYGFGPLQAAGAKKVECPKLPHGKDAIGPYPYAAGLFWGMSYELVQWIAGSRLAYDFAHNASARFAPPYWVKGEDSAFGFFAHAAPFPDLTPIHWGWDIVHDGWEFRSQAERGLCTQHISHTSLVVHSMHTRADFELVRAQFRERCNATCERTTLPFSVDGLADLCGRNPNIPKVYTKCHYGVQVGSEGAAKAARSADGPLPRALPRPKCASVGKNVEFIAATKDGGTITCTEEEPIQKQLAPPWLRPAV